MLPPDNRIAPTDFGFGPRGLASWRIPNSFISVLESNLGRVVTQPSSEPRIMNPAANPGMPVSSSPAQLNQTRRPLNPQIISLTLFALAISSALIAWKLKDRHLAFNSSGMLFPNGMLPQLDWRKKRNWSDLSALSFIKAQLNSENKLQFYFESGGSASLAINRLSKQDLDKLFSSLDKYAEHVRRSPELVAFRHETLSELGKDKSFTSIWEEELASSFTATNFVALSPESRLQNGGIKVIMHLSSGGLSAVYLVERGKQVLVLKESVLPPGTSETQRQKSREMFKREAEMLMKLKHEQIAKVLDHFQENDRDYLLLEYIPGATLREYVRRHGAQSESKVLDWAKQIAEILAYLHSQDPPVLHRDLTPDNLMITPSGKIVLIDFGAANHFLGTATGTIVGKQFYIAPEQFRGKAAPASDIYALGASIYFLLTGSDPEALAQSHPKQRSALVSAEADALVARCTALQQKDRISTSQELLTALKNLGAQTSSESQYPVLNPESGSAAESEPDSMPELSSMHETGSMLDSAPSSARLISLREREKQAR